MIATNVNELTLPMSGGTYLYAWWPAAKQALTTFFLRIRLALQSLVSETATAFWWETLVPFVTDTLYGYRVAFISVLLSLVVLYPVYLVLLVGKDQCCKIWKLASFGIYLAVLLAILAVVFHTLLCLIWVSACGIPQADLQPFWREKL
jgi:hypothetical protein